MPSPPKSSLIERLVQDRLRSGDLEASAAQLLQLGDLPPGYASSVAASEAPAGPGSLAMTLDGPPNGLPNRAPNGIVSLAAPAISPLGPVTQSLVMASEPAIALARAQVAPMALELRPLAEPTLQPAEAPLFPASGSTPSALVPPPATALPVKGPSAMPAPLDPLNSAEAPVIEPAPTVPAAPLSAPDRPDLVQGPPTIDAVALERGGMVDWSRTRSRISEEFRLVQRQILRAAFGPGAEPGFSNLLMVTSARPGEGKSFTSVNLSGSIARQGDHHVLLVDADSKRDSFCYALGLAEMRGLLDLVANPKLDPSPLIVKTPIDRLSILPVGRERERSAELFSTKEMTRLIQSLGRRYADRLLVLDAPPCLSTSDPAVLAPVVGQILFVVEADRTQREEVEASLDLIQACPNITLVLNKQQISSRYTFGAYSSYYSS